MTAPKQFAIFYADGSVYEGGGETDKWVEVKLKISSDWLHAPADGVQAVVQENPYTCRYVWRNSDFYYWVPEGEVCSTDDIGPYMRAHLPMIKHGLCTTEEQFESVMRRVKGYNRIPRTGERRPKPDEGI